MTTKLSLVAPLDHKIGTVLQTTEEAVSTMVEEGS
jgi:hypothetical protein